MLASLVPALARNVKIEVADSKPTSKQTLNSNDRAQQACMVTIIQEYVSKLGTPDLTNADFEALVRCDFQAIPVLSQALKNDRAGVRSSAAYALGQIGEEAYVAVPNLVMILRDDSNNDVRAIAAYTLGRIDSKAEAAVPRLITIFKNPDEDSVVHDQAAQALDNIGTKEAISALNQSQSASSSAVRSISPFSSHLRSLGESFPLPSVQESVQTSTSSASPLICQIPGIKSILPRCR